VSPVAERAPASPPTTRQVILVDMPGVPQSRIVVGGVGGANSYAEFFPIQVLTGIIRDRLSSDRNPLLRDYTTGVRSGAKERRPAHLCTTRRTFIVVIDHPLVNHVACAELHVTRVTSPTGSPASADFAVDYNVGGSYDGSWFIRSPVPFTADTQFDVVIDPAQVHACTDVIFADGFDG